MSQHPSLRSSDKDKAHRSVLKRYERIRILKDKERWKVENSVFGLPKVKVVKFKIKKEKAAPAEAAVAEGAAPAAPGAAEAAPQAKAAAPQAKAAPAGGKAPAAKTPGAEGKK